MLLSNGRKSMRNCCLGALFPWYKKHGKTRKLLLIFGVLLLLRQGGGRYGAESCWKVRGAASVTQLRGDV